MSIISNYKIFCVTENMYVTGWGTSAPTTCYNNIDHQVNLDSVSIVSSYDIDTVIVSNEKIPPGREPTGGQYKSKTLVFTCAPNAVTTGDVINKIPWSINWVGFSATTAHIGDTVSLVANPDTPIGVLPSDVSSGVSTIPINVGMVPYLIRGFELKLSDGTNMDDLGTIVSVDSTNYTVTTEFGTTHSFSASTPTMFLSERKVVDELYINRDGLKEFGKFKIGASYVPANSLTRVIYTNNSDQAKQFVGHYEFYY